MTKKEIEQRIDMHRNSINALEGMLRHINTAPPNTCAYINNEDYGLYMPSCTNNEDDYFDWSHMRNFKYCPYCGKEVHLIDT